MKLWVAPAGLHVEPAQVQDAPALARLHAAGFFRGWPASDFASYLRDPDTPAYIACDRKRQIAGFAMLRLADTEAELLTLVVDRKWRGKGIGSALMRAALHDLSITPVRTLFLEVDEGNLAAVRLYRNLGFAETGRRRGYYPKPDGTAATALVMRCNVG